MLNVPGLINGEVARGGYFCAVGVRAKTAAEMGVPGPILPKPGEAVVGTVPVILPNASFKAIYGAALDPEGQQLKFLIPNNLPGN